MVEESIIELVAEVQHEIWAHWMNYMFSQGEIDEYAGGDWVMPVEKVERWTRQMNTPYCQLTHKEQESDRHQAYEFLTALGIMGGNIENAIAS